MGAGDVCTMPRSLRAGRRQRNCVVEEVQIVDCFGLVADLTLGAAVVLGLFSSEARVVLEGLINALRLLSLQLRHCGRCELARMRVRRSYIFWLLMMTGTIEP